MDGLEQLKRNKKQLNNFIVLDVVCVVIVLIVVSLINFDWGSIFKVVQPQIPTPSTGDVLNTVGTGDIEHQISTIMSTNMRLLTTIVKIALSIIAMSQLFRMSIDILYIMLPTELEKLIPKQLMFDNVKLVKESKEPTVNYLKLIVPALVILIITSAVFMFGVDNLIYAIIYLLSR